MSNEYLINSDPKGYKGNQNLKRPDEIIEWTPELILEWNKCKNDPIYFIETYIKIIGKKGLQNFTLYDYQKEMILSFLNHRNTVLTCARQSGKSTVTCGFILWFILFNTEKTVALLANKGEIAQEIFGRIQFAYQYLPKWLQQGIVEWNKRSISLENNSRAIATATSGTAIRGFSADLLFIDEAAFVDGWDEFFTSVYPILTEKENSKTILVSTPNGLNHFHSIWANALQGKNNYNPILVTWEQVPGRDEKWKEDVISGLNGDLEKFNQEMCGEFLGSSGTLISGSKLKQLTSEYPIVESEGLYQFKQPEKNNRYMMVCDVSRGKGLDYSAFQLIDVTSMPYSQVCVYRNNAVTPVDYAEVIFRTAKAYNNAFVMVEINDIGEQVSHELNYTFGYENLLYTENAGRSGKKVTGGFGSGSSVDKGIRTTKIVKAIGCSVLKLLIEQNQLILNDEFSINELKTFSKKRNSYEAETGKHDDLVMCLVLFAWLTTQEYFKAQTDINTLAGLRDKTDEDIDSDLSPFGFVDAGFDEVENINSGPEFLPDGWMWASDF